MAELNKIKAQAAAAEHKAERLRAKLRKEEQITKGMEDENAKTDTFIEFARRKLARDKKNPEYLEEIKFELLKSRVLDDNAVARQELAAP